MLAHSRERSDWLLKEVACRLQLDGVWHTGIVFNNTEYFFGSGIQSAPAGATPFGPPLKIVSLG